MSRRSSVVTVGDDVTVRKMSSDEADAVSALVVASFDEFIGPEYDERGRTEFHRYAEPDAIRRRIRKDHFVMLAEVKSTLVGMIEIREANHVSLLFVAKAFHHRGVARELFDQALVEARQIRPGLAHVTVNSSRHGLSAYEKLGFRQTGPERAVNGIVFIPMAKRLQGIS